MKTTVIVGAVIIVVLSVLYVVLPAKPATAPALDTTSTTTATDIPAVATTTVEVPPITVGGKIKAANFTGKLESVNTGCFADGECYAVVDGKHLTLTIGRSQEELGSVIGVPSIGDLESAIGSKVEVYAKDNLDGTYTLYGSKGFYLKVTTPSATLPTPPATAAACVVGGCSGELCVDSSEPPRASNCIWSESYTCYKTTTCERQASGQCGWTNTPELKQCLATKATIPTAAPQPQ
jgi:hypothetical protein